MINNILVYFQTSTPIFFSFPVTPSSDPINVCMVRIFLPQDAKHTCYSQFRSILNNLILSAKTLPSCSPLTPHHLRTAAILAVVFLSKELLAVKWKYNRIFHVLKAIYILLFMKILLLRKWALSSTSK